MRTLKSILTALAIVSVMGFVVYGSYIFTTNVLGCVTFPEDEAVMASIAHSCLIVGLYTLPFIVAFVIVLRKNNIFKF
jgi:hypothetical protein